MAASQTNQFTESPKRISGVIKDTSGETLIGATVIEEGTTNGVVIDHSGEFTISVQPDARLEVQFLGYETKTIDVGDKNIY